jgi:hypothetical protein
VTMKSPCWRSGRVRMTALEKTGVFGNSWFCLLAGDGGSDETEADR